MALEISFPIFYALCCVCVCVMHFVAACYFGMRIKDVVETACKYLSYRE